MQFTSTFYAEMPNEEFAAEISCAAGGGVSGDAASGEACGGEVETEKGSGVYIWKTLTC